MGSNAVEMMAMYGESHGQPEEGQMASESEIRARIEKKRERLGKARRVKAQIDAGTLEEFEALDDVGRREVFDADPGLFRQHMEAIREKNMHKLEATDERD